MPLTIKRKLFVPLVRPYKYFQILTLLLMGAGAFEPYSNLLAIRTLSHCYIYLKGNVFSINVYTLECSSDLNSFSQRCRIILF